HALMRADFSSDCFGVELAAAKGHAILCCRLRRYCGISDKRIQEAAFQTRDEFGGPSPSRHLSLSNLEASSWARIECLVHQSFTRSALIVSFGPTMRLTAWHHLYRANLTNAYTKKNIQTTSSIKMTPINNGAIPAGKFLRRPCARP